MLKTPLERLRKLCLAFPEAHEVTAWNEPTFRVKNKMFATYASSDNHQGAGRASAWVKARLVTQDLLLRAEPTLYFKPPYVGPKGWVGVWLDGKSIDWNTLEGLLLDAYIMTAPKRLIAQLDNDT